MADVPAGESIDLDAFDIPDIVASHREGGRRRDRRRPWPAARIGEGLPESLLDPVVDGIRARWMWRMASTSCSPSARYLARCFDFLLTAIVNWYAAQNPIHRSRTPTR